MNVKNAQDEFLLDLSVFVFLPDEDFLSSSR
jgi:hypothetical protein